MTPSPFQLVFSSDGDAVTSPWLLTESRLPGHAPSGDPPLTAAEFFAGIGLVRAGLERAGIAVVWANDIEPVKRAVYASNFDAADYLLADVRDVRGVSVPAVDIATASFPCVDFSLAGHRRGIEGEQSGLFFEFARVLQEMGERRPSVVMLENVVAFVSSAGGRDLRVTIEELNAMGYVCDVLTVDARWFVPQSRPRLFIVGTSDRLGTAASGRPGPLRSGAVASFVRANRDLALQELPVPIPPQDGRRLADIVERISSGDERWWKGERLGKFLNSVSPKHQPRLDLLRRHGRTQWRTAYRRTRGGVAVWEIRADDISGCLRTARGGSSRQAVVEVSPGGIQARWMTPREYARLQGICDEFDYSAVTDSQALFGFGDAVCVPVVTWIAQHVLVPAAVWMNREAIVRTAV